MNTITIKAAAKLNLTLDVTGIRADGYHLLSSVMQSVSLYNTLHIARADRLTLLCDDPTLPTDERNTAMRAAALFFAQSGIAPTAAMTLTKRIPYQAGMGSASADAAAALLGLNRLYDEPFSQAELLRLGQQVGADVPFAFCGGTMLAEGIGEWLTPLPSLPPCWFTVVFEGESMSTPLAYRALDALREPLPRTTSAMREALGSGSLADIAACCSNAFSAVCHPAQTARIRERLLRAGALAASLTGSGSAVYGLFADKSAAQRAAAEFANAFVCEPVESALKIV